MTDVPEFSTLRVEVDAAASPGASGPIGRMTLTQGDKLNPLGTVPLREIAEAAQWFNSTDAHIVIVTGEGRGFSSGFDLREFAGRRSGRSRHDVEPRPGRPRPADGRGDGPHVGADDRCDQGSVCRWWRRARRRVRSADRGGRHRVLDPGGRPRYPPRMGRHPAAGARDRPGAHPRAGAHVSPVHAG